MITFSLDFNPDDFQKSIIEQFKKQIRYDLSAAGLSNLAVSFQKDARAEIILHLSGPDEDVAKAKKALGI